MFVLFLERPTHAFVEERSDTCFCWFPAALGRHVGAHTDKDQQGLSIQISINLSKLFSPHNQLKKNCCDLNLGENLCKFTFSQILDFIYRWFSRHASKLNYHASFTQVKNKIA